MNRALINTKTLFFILLLSIPLAIHAEDQAKIIAGWVEAVRIENLEYDIKAKLDSGAKTSSIHAADVTGFEKDGERWVKFTLKLKDSHGNDHELELEKPRVRNVLIKNNDGVHDRRYVVNLNLCFNGRISAAEFTLANRSEYIYDILLGREFLKNVALIDSANTFLIPLNCDIETSD